MTHVPDPARHHERLLIVDFGSQVTQLIARRLRELNVYCEIHPFQNVTDAFLDDFAPKAVIFSGGPASVIDEGSPRPPARIFELGVPILGICYGQQVMMQMLGGEVLRGEGTAEFGRAYVEHGAERIDLLTGWFLDGREQVWIEPWRSCQPPRARLRGLRHLPPARPSPSPPTCPEITTRCSSTRRCTTPPTAGRSTRISCALAGFKGDWTMAAYRDEAIRQIREQVGDAKVICGLSGGVDSSVAAVLIHEAIGDQLTCVFVDHGLLRLNEADEVVTMFRDHYNIPLIHADESERFLTALDGVSDPETKRKTIGKLFIDVFPALCRRDRGRGVPRPRHPLPGCH